MKSVTLPYGKIGSIAHGYGKTKNNKILRILLNRQNIIMLPIVFLLGKAPLVGGMMPFGLAAYVAASEMNVSKLMVLASIIFGMLSGGAQYYIYITLAGIFLYSAGSMALKNFKSGSGLKGAVIASTSIFIPEMVTVYLQGFLLYDLLLAIFHAFVVFSLIFIFRKAAAVIDTRRKIPIVSHEEAISSAIVVSLALTGLSGLGLFGMSIKNILCILLILLFSYRNGASVGAAVGVTVGLIVSMSSNVTHLIIGSFAFCGLLAGVFKNLGKLGCGLGFVLGNAVLTLYLNGSTDVIIYLREIAAAIILFMFIPGTVISLLIDKFVPARNADIYRSGYNGRLKDITVDKLYKFSNAFQELSKTFDEISQTSIVTDKQDITLLFDRIADKVCTGCSLCSHCWDKNFYNTYQILFKIVEKLDGSGRISVGDIPDSFVEKCEKINGLVDAVNNVYEIFKVDMVWQNRLGESRGLVSQQLYGLSKVISNLASEISSDICFNGDMEANIAAELERHEIKAQEVIVTENRWGKYEISIIHKSCGGKRDCVKVIEKAVSSVVGRRMVREGNGCSTITGKGLCSLKFVEDGVYNVTTGVAHVPKYGCDVSGDNSTFMDTGNGKYIVALSDGMGTGQKAAVQSKATIGLLEQFMEVGFDKDTSVKLINSILVLKSSEDCFATIDLSVIDLFNSEVEFIKIGAAPTFIKRSQSVESVKSVSLPAGILSNVDMELIHKKVGSGDFIIMMSDGVIDSLSKDGEGENIVKEYINEIRSMNPQEIADNILDKAYEKSDRKPQDDMMVLVAKIWKKIA